MHLVCFPSAGNPCIAIDCKAHNRQKCYLHRPKPVSILTKWVRSSRLSSSDSSTCIEIGKQSAQQPETTSATTWNENSRWKAALRVKKRSDSAKLATDSNNMPSLSATRTFQLDKHCNRPSPAARDAITETSSCLHFPVHEVAKHISSCSFPQESHAFSSGYTNPSTIDMQCIAFRARRAHRGERSASNNFIASAYSGSFRSESQIQLFSPPQANKSFERQTDAPETLRTSDEISRRMPPPRDA